MTTDRHPVWCDLGLCDATDPDLPTWGGAHRSAPRTVGPAALLTDQGAISAVSAALYRAAAPWPTDTYLILHADGHEVSMHLGEAAGVLTQLSALVESGVSA